MPLYDLFREDKMASQPYRHVARKEFMNDQAVAAYCRRHRLRFQPAEATDAYLEKKGLEYRGTPAERPQVKAVQQKKEPEKPKAEERKEDQGRSSRPLCLAAPA